MFTVTSKKSGKTYILHARPSGSNGTVLYFFAGEAKTGGGSTPLDALPEGMEVTENARTGLPMLRRKK